MLLAPALMGAAANFVALLDAGRWGERDGWKIDGYFIR
jgi:hypothetical protein